MARTFAHLPWYSQAFVAVFLLMFKLLAFTHRSFRASAVGLLFGIIYDINYGWCTGSILMRAVISPAVWIGLELRPPVFNIRRTRSGAECMRGMKNERSEWQRDRPASEEERSDRGEGIPAPPPVCRLFFWSVFERLKANTTFSIISLTLISARFLVILIISI